AFPGSASKRQLLRVEVTSDKIMDVQLPPLTMWLDEERTPVRSEADMPGLGKLTLYRTTKALARRPGSGTIDIGYDQLIPVRRRISHPYDISSAVYRITLKGEDKPQTAFAQDSRQHAENVQGGRLDLHVHALREPAPVPNPSAAPAEFSESCYFIN